MKSVSLKITLYFLRKWNKERQEFINRDDVIDPRETWKNWIKRTFTFENPPMVERHELQEHEHPHKSVFSAIENLTNGINPYPPGHKYNNKSPEKSIGMKAEKYIIEEDEKTNEEMKQPTSQYGIQDIQQRAENEPSASEVTQQDLKL